MRTEVRYTVSRQQSIGGGQLNLPSVGSPAQEMEGSVSHVVPSDEQILYHVGRGWMVPMFAITHPCTIRQSDALFDLRQSN